MYYHVQRLIPVCTRHCTVRANYVSLSQNNISGRYYSLSIFKMSYTGWKGTTDVHSRFDVVSDAPIISLQINGAQINFKCFYRDLFCERNVN